MFSYRALYKQYFLVPNRFVDPNLPVPIAKEMDRQLQVIKRARDGQNCYAALHPSSQVIEAGEKVFLRDKSKRSSVKL